MASRRLPWAEVQDVNLSGHTTGPGMNPEEINMDFQSRVCAGNGSVREGQLHRSACRGHEQ